MNGREELLATTFVELADSLVDDFDVIELLSHLGERCVELSTPPPRVSCSPMRRACST